MSILTCGFPSVPSGPCPKHGQQVLPELRRQLWGALEPKARFKKVHEWTHLHGMPVSIILDNGTAEHDFLQIWVVVLRYLYGSEIESYGIGLGHSEVLILGL